MASNKTVKNCVINIINFRNLKHSQMVLSFKFLLTYGTEELAFITVCELVFSQGTGIIETFMALVTLHWTTLSRGHLTLPILITSFHFLLVFTWIHCI